MRKRKSTCGLCKPSKKWKQNNTKKANQIKKSLLDDYFGQIKLRILR